MKEKLLVTKKFAALSYQRSLFVGAASAAVAIKVGEIHIRIVIVVVVLKLLLLLLRIHHWLLWIMLLVVVKAWRFEIIASKK